MVCQTCGSERVASVCARCSEWRVSDPSDHGTKNGKCFCGDNMDFDVCLDCGQMQGKWPAPTKR